MNFVLNPPESYNYTVDVLSGTGCILPFKQLFVHESGNIGLCCPTWLRETCGNIFTDSPQEILENVNRKRLLNDMSQGKYTSCNDLCPLLNSSLTDGKIKDSPLNGRILTSPVRGSRFESHIQPLDKLKDAVASSEYQITFGYDRSCNLQCPSCRKGLILHQPSEVSDPKIEKMLKIHENTKSLINLLISRGEAVTLAITGSGDPFASPLYWGYIKELSDMDLPDNFRIRLITNGVLMTQNAWNEIEPLWKHISSISISVDAATVETYKIVRYPGSFINLKRNLTVLDDMVFEKKFANLEGWRTIIVVQSANYKELADFARWQLTYKTLSTISTVIIQQWGHLSDEEIKNMLKIDLDELRVILSDPIFNDPRVLLGNLSSFKKVDI